ncbi:M-phase phosphoprotein 6 [Scaptodrosophila lebanonensis]|uniref:M-phase phosphoprotein 6 n=1 Tax=Drosophila lebanonensis TaxID=7225 RepID=A0A6J2TWX5_DROLE|nr:M-phase phosphoprotein 6 [Scaptodrosophila lebanonensis]
MYAKHNKPKLSRGVLDMKFMQRTKAKVDKEADDEQGRALYSNEISGNMLNSNSNFIIEPSYSICEGLIDGRLSFRGMNPELERLMELEQAEKQVKTKQEQPKEVSDVEMAKYMQRKFNGKNDFNKRKPNAILNNKAFKPKKQKHHFMKPREDDDSGEAEA